MYITAGTFNIMLRQVVSFGLSEAEVLNALPLDSKLLDNTTNQIDAAIIARFIEYVIGQKPDIRIGLEMGFRFPVSIMGVILNIYQNCRTLGDVFNKSLLYASAVNTICRFSHYVDERYLYHVMTVSEEFEELYPSVTRHIYESQYGIILQLMYALTGKHITPVYVTTPFPAMSTPDLLEELLKCPVEFGKTFVMAFERNITDYSVINANFEMLLIAERLIAELQKKEQKHSVSSKVRNYLLQAIPGINLSLKETARSLNMSGRTLQRKLLSENTSYQNILDKVRSELACKYLAEDISFSEVAFLLGFESQSAFNKFFQKHFKGQPSDYRS